jgi:Leucine-rich repeat (LRR) protein
LNLTNNKIRSIQNLPPNLRELNLTGNLVDTIEPLRSPLPNLIHLGVAYNLLKTHNLPVIAKNFPNLFCLDAAFNEL